MGRDYQDGGGQGQSHNGGRGRGCFHATSSKSAAKDCKFHLHAVKMQQQSVTHYTVKDHVVQHAQKMCKNNMDVAELLKKEEMKDLSAPVPRRKVSVASDASRQVEQDGFDIVCKVEA